MISRIASQVVGFLQPNWLQDVTSKTIRADLLAGFTSATVVLPQAVAFAAIAGLPPQYGLYTAIVLPVVAGLFGASRVMVSGPTLVISALTFSALVGQGRVNTADFVAVAIALALLVGVFQICFGALQLGKMVNFISHSVMLGFTAAAALLIVISQIKDALGIEAARGKTIVDTIANLVAAIPQANVFAFLIAAVTLTVLVALRIFVPRLPAFLVALAAGGLVCAALGPNAAQIKMIGSLPAIVPAFALPELSFNLLHGLSEAAFAIALLGVVEAISIGRVFAAKTGKPFDPNREIVAQGLSNVAGSLFQCYPGSGSFTRSGVNYEAGAKTPLSAIASSFILILILVLVAPLFQRLPVPAIAAVILFVAYRLVDFAAIKRILVTSFLETSIVIVTFLGGVFVSLEFAIYAGVILSLLFFLSKTTKPGLAIGAPDHRLPRHPFRNAELHGLKECPQAVFARLDGPLYFGSVSFLERELERIRRERAQQKVLVLILRGVGGIDLQGAELLIDEVRRRRSAGGDMFIVARYLPLRKELENFGVLHEFSAVNIVESKGEAVEAIIEKIDLSICATCKNRIFTECAAFPGADQFPTRGNKVEARAS